MPAAICVGDSSVGHPTPGPTNAVQGSPKHFLNGKPVMRVTDKWTNHHSGGGFITSAQGSSTVFSDGLARVRQGDELSCGDHAATGTPTCNIG